MVKQVQAHPLATNPLFIRTLAEELRLFGVHEQLQRHLDHYLTSETIDDLFERVLARLEKDCGKKQVKAAMTAIWASRAGLIEKEILGIANLTPATWAAMRHALNEALLETNGKITFAHNYVRLAIKDRYLHSVKLQKSVHRALVRWFSSQPADARRAQEEPWQLHKLGAHKRIRKVLVNPLIFLELWKFNTYELLGYWRDHWSRDELLLEYQKIYPSWVEWRTQFRENALVWPELVTALADAIWGAGYYSDFFAAIQIYARDLLAKRYGARDVSVAKRDISCAHYLRQLADSASLVYAKRAVQVLEPLGPSEDLVSAYVVMSLCLSSDGEIFKAEDYYRLASSTLYQIPDSTNRILMRHKLVIGKFFSDNNDYDRIGERYVISNLVEDEERIFGTEHRLTLESVDLLVGCLLREELWIEASNLAMSHYLRCYRVFGEDHPQTGYAAGKFGIASFHLDDFESAEWGLSKATEILAKNFPEGHQSRSVFLQPLAETYERMQRPAQAEVIRERLKSEMIGHFFYWS
jgi:hypothetical protein